MFIKVTSKPFMVGKNSVHGSHRVYKVNGRRFENFNNGELLIDETKTSPSTGILYCFNNAIFGSSSSSSDKRQQYKLRLISNESINEKLQ